MALGMEMMVSGLLRGFGVDPDAIKAEVLQRIAQFEHNVAVLNETQRAILANQKAIADHLGIAYNAPQFIEPPVSQAAE